MTPCTDQQKKKKKKKKREHALWWIFPFQLTIKKKKK